MSENRTMSPSATIVESSRLLPWLMFTSVLSGFAVAIAVWCLINGTVTERETRMLEYYVMELDGKLMRAGALESHESWSAQKRKRKEAK